jgi:hypothetical protein
LEYNSLLLDLEISSNSGIIISLNINNLYAPSFSTSSDACLLNAVYYVSEPVLDVSHKFVPSETNVMVIVLVPDIEIIEAVLKIDEKLKVPVPPVIIRLITTPGKSVDGDTLTTVDTAVAGSVNLKILPVLRSSVAPAPVRTPTETTLEDITPLVLTGGPWSVRPPVGSTASFR